MEHWYREGCRVIQGIWKSDVRGWDKIVEDVSSERRNQRFFPRRKGNSGVALQKDLDSLVFALDQPSEHLLKSLGVNRIRFNGYRSPYFTTGVSSWSKKILCMLESLRYYEHVLWMDFDCVRIDEIPSDFWDRLLAGPALQMKLTQANVPKCQWREADVRKVGSGGFIYCRSKRVLARSLEKMEDNIKSPLFSDQTVLSWSMDQLMGGWGGVDCYQYQKYDIPWYTIWSEVIPCDKIIFAGR